MNTYTAIVETGKPIRGYKCPEEPKYNHDKAPYQPFYKPDGMSDEEYQHEKRIAEQKLQQYQAEFEDAYRDYESAKQRAIEEALEFEDQEQIANLVPECKEIRPEKDGFNEWIKDGDFPLPELKIVEVEQFWNELQDKWEDRHEPARRFPRVPGKQYRRVLRIVSEKKADVTISDKLGNVDKQPEGERPYQKIIRYERHFADGSKEILECQDCANFVENMGIADGVCSVRGYLNFKPVNWTVVQPTPATQESGYYEHDGLIVLDNYYHCIEANRVSKDALGNEIIEGKFMVKKRMNDERQEDLLVDLITLYQTGDQSGDVQKARVLSKFTIYPKQVKP